MDNEPSMDPSAGEEPPAKPTKKQKPISPGPRGAINHQIDYAEVKSEPWIVTLLEKLSSERYKLDSSVDGELREMASHHTAAYKAGNARLPIVTTKNDLLTLQESNALCLAQRDRVTDILVSYTAIKYALDSLWEKAESRLLENPSFQKLTNQSARTAFINAVLENVHSRRINVKKTIAMAEILQGHLTHTHFAMKQQADLGVAYLSLKSA